MSACRHSINSLGFDKRINDASVVFVHHVSPYMLLTGMVNNTSIDWFFPWPEQALYAVASVFISPDVSP